MAAPNRVLDLGELDRPDFERITREMEALLRQAEGTYLHPGKRWEYPWALERALLQPGSSVLDAGAGNSVFPLYLARAGHAVTAVDVALDARPAWQPASSLHYLQADLAALPLRHGAYDAVFCISVIEHLSDRRIPLALAELRRVLRPGGRLLLTTDFHENAEEEIWYRGPGEPFRVEWRVFDDERLHRLVLQAPGFEVDGELDLAVDWQRTRIRMREYHGYPYTSVGVALVRSA